MRARYIFLALLLVFEGASAQPAYAKSPDFPPAPDGFRIGMEIELHHDGFENLAPDFDFDLLQQEKGAQISPRLSNDFLRGYLKDNPQAFVDLPEGLKVQLTQGLQLQNLIIQKPQSLLGADGKSLTPTSTFVLAGKGVLQIEPSKLQTGQIDIIQGKAKPEVPLASAFQQKGVLEIPKSAQWQALYDRWDALDVEAKRSAVRWENLTSLKKAELAIDFAKGKVSLKKDVPEETKKLFERFFWNEELGVIEFRHREDLKVTDPQAFYEDVTSLARRAGIKVERKILDPGKYTHSGSSFHFHVSVADRDITFEGQALNRLALIRRISRGILNDLTSPIRHQYDSEARGKGLVRIVDSNRLEMRFHILPLQEELGFVLQVLNLKQPEALNLIDSEIKGLMSNYVVEKLAEHQVTYLSGFAKYLTQEQKTRFKAQLELGDYVNSISHGIPKDFWIRVPNLMSNANWNIQKAILLQLNRSANWPPAFLARVPDLMMSEDLNVQRSISIALSYKLQWSPEIWSVIPKVLINAHQQVQVALTQGIMEQQEWPLEFWNQLPHVLLNCREKGILNLIQDALKTRRVRWPEKFWQQVPGLMASPDQDVQALIFAALEKQSIWPDAVTQRAHEVWKEIPNTDEPRQELKRRIAMVLESRLARCLGGILSNLAGS